MFELPMGQNNKKPINRSKTQLAWVTIDQTFSQLRLQPSQKPQGNLITGPKSIMPGPFA